MFLERTHNVADKKQQCFSLFEEGKKPTQIARPQFVALGTAYRYYKEWLVIKINEASLKAVVSGVAQKQEYLNTRYLETVVKSLKTGTTPITAS